MSLALYPLGYSEPLKVGNRKAVLEPHMLFKLYECVSKTVIALVHDTIAHVCPEHVIQCHAGVQGQVHAHGASLLYVLFRYQLLGFLPLT